MIGDGMGLTQISGALSNYSGQNAFARFSVIGFSQTASADNYVTDSGAGATAFAIGKKAKNGAIGVDAFDQAQTGLFELIKQAKGKTAELQRPQLLMQHQLRFTRMWLLEILKKRLPNFF